MRVWTCSLALLTVLALKWLTSCAKADSIYCSDPELCSSQVGVEDNDKQEYMRFDRSNTDLRSLQAPYMRFGRSDQLDKRGDPFLRFGKRGDPFLRFGKRGDPFLRFGKRGDPFLRFGKRGDPFLRFGKRGDPFLRFGKRGDPFLRFGKRGDPFLRFGKRGDPFLRFGKRGDPFLRFGKRGDPFLRFGKRDNPYLIFGKKSEPYMRFGKRGDPFLRFGKRGDPFLRFGKRECEEIESSGTNNVMQLDSPNDVLKRDDPYMRFGRGDPFLRFGRGDPFLRFGRNDPFLRFGRNDPFLRFGRNDPFLRFGRNDPFLRFGKKSSDGSEGDGASELSPEDESNAVEDERNRKKRSTLSGPEDGPSAMTAEEHEAQEVSQMKRPYMRFGRDPVSATEKQEASSEGEHGKDVASDDDELDGEKRSRYMRFGRANEQDEFLTSNDEDDATSDNSDTVFSSLVHSGQPKLGQEEDDKWQGYLSFARAQRSPHEYMRFGK